MKHWMLLGALMVGCGTAQEVPADLSKLLEVLKKDEGGQMTMLAQTLLGRDGGNKLFIILHSRPIARP